MMRCTNAILKFFFLMSLDISDTDFTLVLVNPTCNFGMTFVFEVSVISMGFPLTTQVNGERYILNGI
jgi:hypothetical protein